MEQKTSSDGELYAVFVPNSPEPTVFKELKEVRKFLDSPLGKKDGTRFKKCIDEEDLKSFFQEQQKEGDSPKPSFAPSTSKEPVSPYRSLPTARFTEFRLAIEQKDQDKFAALLNENPRFLINTNTDSPAIVQEGYRFNTMHIACRSSNCAVVKRCLELARDHEWLTHVYATDRCVEERSQFLLDRLLNTPDLIQNNTPLHYACKFGYPDIVRLLLSYPTCKRYPKNRYNEKPMDVLCRVFKGSAEEKERVSEEISIIFRRGLSPARRGTPARPIDADGDAPSSPLSHLTASLHISNSGEISTTLPTTPLSATAGTVSRIKSLAEARIPVSSPVASEVSLLTEDVKTPQNKIDNTSKSIDIYSPMTAEIMKMADELRDKLNFNTSAVSNQIEKRYEILESDDSDAEDEDIFEDASQDPVGDVGDDDTTDVSDSCTSSTGGESDKGKKNSGTESDDDDEYNSKENRENTKKFSSDTAHYCTIL